MNLFLRASEVGIVALWVASQKVPIPYVVHLLLLVTFILYVSCHYSLGLLTDQALARGEKDPTKKEGEEDGPVAYDTLRKEDAMQFPLIGSASLFGLYCAFKFFDPEIVNLIISVYFCLMGTAALTATFAPMIDTILPEKLVKAKYSKEIKINHPLPEFIGGESPWDLSVEVTFSDIIALIGSIVFSVCYFQKKHWTMNNVLGICFCLQGIERFSLGTYKTGAILLCGLFFYDIFWVFGTDVMVTVAKSLDGPIKILFPRSLTPDPESGKIELSLLGLGDIVIPGFFLSLLLRFDANNAKIPYFPMNVHCAFPKPYFHSGLIGYVLGMGTTMFVMIKFQAAQPALLYLVPGCLGSSLLTATIRGELGALFQYSEEPEEEEEDKKKEESKDDKTKDDTTKKDD